MSKNYVYRFGDGKADGDGSMRNLLGGKGANLAEMSLIGLPVPAGFTITTEVCTYYLLQYGNTFPRELRDQVMEGLAHIEQVMGAKFGDPENPLLLSCRSGARDSMPGMMDTVLNIGLNEATLQGLSKATGNERFAWDCYRRFVQMFGDVVLGMKPESKKEIDPFEHIMEGLKHERGVENDTDLDVAALRELVARFKTAVKDRTGKDFPDDPIEQVFSAIAAVFDSWNNDRAIVYRRTNRIPSEWGTAANVQAMVFGNMGKDCATGVGFTRNPATGVKGVFGDYLVNAQGEDVVAGIRTPKKLTELKDDMPGAYQELEGTMLLLEEHYRDVQDIEFTVQRGKLWMLQTRNGKRTGFAAVRTAVEMYNEGLIRMEEALTRIPPADLDQLLQPVFDSAAKQRAIKEGRLLAKGINAGPGAATGRIMFFADEAEQWVHKHPDAHVILVRRETSPDDLRGMQVAKGILTAFGGASSHAALVSRQLGKVCIVGCQQLAVDYHARTLTIGERVFHEGDSISLDGSTGEVLEGQITTKPSEVVQVLIDRTMDLKDSEICQLFVRLMEWADEFRTLKVRANADKPEQAAQAVAFGAEGIGLCRTEHMFFNHVRLMREMLLAEREEDRQKAISKMLPRLREDFMGIFREMEERPVTIRLLDPPLHEFLPHDAADQQALADQIGINVSVVQERVKALHELNPMLGFRGCRLGIVHPNLTAMQARAILEAACIVKKEGIDVHPEIMIPLVGYSTEFKAQAAIIHETAKVVLAEQGEEIEYLIGTMIELPRACVTADEIVREGGAQFFSFGTNDLTQTTLGMSRDDYGSFMGHYRESDLVKFDPFMSIDTSGVGEMMRIGTERGRSVNVDLKIGICGEHGGDPESVAFCHKTGLNYVSCSPFRVPIARLAAAQAAIRQRMLETSLV